MSFNRNETVTVVVTHVVSYCVALLWSLFSSSLMLAPVSLLASVSSLSLLCPCCHYRFFVVVLTVRFICSGIHLGVASDTLED